MSEEYELERREGLKANGWIRYFREGLGRALKNGLEFHVREDGYPAYEARYDEVDDFSEGLASGTSENSATPSAASTR